MTGIVKLSGTAVSFTDFLLGKQREELVSYQWYVIHVLSRWKKVMLHRCVLHENWRGLVNS